MKSYASGRTVYSEGSIAAVQDSAGDPIIFSIGSDRRHYAIMREAGGKTGWRQIDLTASLGSRKAQAFGVSQDRSGEIYLAVALEKAEDPKYSELYITPALSNDPSRTDWGNLGSRWIYRPYASGLVTIKQVLMGTNDDKKGSPEIIVATEEMDRGVQHYRINSNPKAGDWFWETYPLPENATEIVEMALGNHRLGRGVYTLFRRVDGLALEFTTFKDPVYKTTYNVNMEVPPNATSLSVVPDDRGFSDLYVGGDGLYVFRARAQKSPARYETIIGAKDAKGISDIIARRDGERISLWLIRGERLLYLSGKVGDQPNWTPVIPLRAGVGLMAPLRNWQKMANEITVVGLDNSLSYLWQDPDTSLWKESDIPLYDTKELLTFNCYITHVSLTYPDGRPVIDQPVSVTASEWTHAEVNGSNHTLDPYTPVEVRTDVQGNVTIINKVSSISTPRFYLSAELLEGEVEANPASKVEDGLKSIKSGEDLMNARTSDGSPLLDKSIGREKADAAAGAIQQLTTLSDSLPRGGAGSRARLRLKSSQRGQGGPREIHECVADFRSKPTAYSWGMSFSEDAVTYHSPEAFRMMRAQAPGVDAGVVGAPMLRGWGDAISVWIGDIIEALEKGLEKAFKFVVNVFESAAEFIIDLGTRVVKFVVETAEQVFRVINWLLKETLGIDLEKVIEWLGFIFNWGDMVKTHDVFVNVANQFMKYGSVKIGEAEKRVSSFFEDMKRQARKLGPIQDGDKGLKSEQDRLTEERSPKARDAAGFVNTPSGNWANYQMLHGGVLEGMSGSSISSPFSGAIEGFTAFYNDVLQPTMTSIGDTLETLAGDIARAFEDGSLTANDIIRQLGADVVVGLIDAFQKIAVGMMKLMRDLLDSITRMLSKEIHIPFLSALYERVVGRPLSILSGFSLLVAIPSTVLYKIISGHAPFEGGAERLDTAGYDEIIQMLHGGPLMRASEAGREAASRGEGLLRATVSTAAAIYSHVGGAVFGIIGIISTVIGLLDIGTEGKTVPPSVKIVLGVIGLAASFPVADKPGIMLEIGRWITHIHRVLMGGLLSYVEGSTIVQGISDLLFGTIDTILYIFVIVEELAAGKGSTGMYWAKFINNIVSTIAKYSSGIAKIAKDPYVKGGAAAIGAGLGFGAAGFNIARIAAANIDSAHYSSY